MSDHEKYIRRCFQLARKARKSVKSNPNVGAVLVYRDTIIGEGYHQVFGGPHAEVNAFKNVLPKNRHLISDCSLYVSLEPCCIENKTPACTSRIIKEGIKRVIIGCLDPNPKVAGNGIKLLQANGIEVISSILENEAESLIQAFVCNLEQRPFVTLKWAKSKDHFISKTNQQTWLSNEISKIYVHKLRSEVDGILIGTKTALIDNPKLNTRHYPGESPLRIVIDRKAKIPKDHHLHMDGSPTVFVTEKNSGLIISDNKHKLELDFTSDYFLDRMLKALFQQYNVCRLLVEGGANTLKSFIEKNLWDHAHIINTSKVLEEGIKAPNIKGKLVQKIDLQGDTCTLLKPYVK